MKSLCYKLIIFLSLIFALLGFGGCTHPNGDIGSLFGTWAFDEITVDGEKIPDYTEGIVISFQGPVFQVIRMYDYGYCQIYGRWSREGDQMILDGKTENLGGTFPSQLGLPENGIFSFTVVSESKKNMVWRRIGEDGAVWQYTLRKLL